MAQQTKRRKDELTNFESHSKWCTLYWWQGQRISASADFRCIAYCSLLESRSNSLQHWVYSKWVYVPVELHQACRFLTGSRQSLGLDHRTR